MKAIGYPMKSLIGFLNYHKKPLKTVVPENVILPLKEQ